MCSGGSKKSSSQQQQQQQVATPGGSSLDPHSASSGGSARLGGGYHGGAGASPSSAATSSVLPQQPFAQDSNMPVLPPPNTNVQLEEARRRLQDQHQQQYLKTSRSVPHSLSHRQPRMRSGRLKERVFRLIVSAKILCCSFKRLMCYCFRISRQTRCTAR